MTRQPKPKKNELLKFDSIQEFKNRLETNFNSTTTSKTKSSYYRGKSKFGRKAKITYIPDWLSEICKNSYIDKEPLHPIIENIIYGVCNLECGKTFTPSPFTTLKILATLSSVSTSTLHSSLNMAESTARVYNKVVALCVLFSEKQFPYKSI